MEFKYRVDGRGRMEEDIVEDILKARNIKDVRHFSESIKTRPDFASETDKN